MKRFLVLIAILCVCSVGVIGCGAGKPGWAGLNAKVPSYDDAIVAVGSAMHSPNAAIMRRQAETDARISIARVIGTRVQELIKNWAQQNQSSVADQTAFNEYFESVGRAITNQNLPGVRIEETFFDKDSNTLYALAIYKRGEAIQIAKDKMEAIRQELEVKKQEERLFKSRQEADRAFQELDNLIEKQLGTQP